MKSKYLEVIILSSLLTLLMLVIRNFAFQYHDSVIYFNSVIVGIIVGIVGRRNVSLVYLPIAFFFVYPLIFSEVLYFSTDYFISAVPILIISALVLRKRYYWVTGYVVMYYFVVLFHIYYRFENSLAIDYPDGLSLTEFDFSQVNSAKPIVWDEDANAYAVLYWHIGCGYCHTEEEVLYNFVKSNEDLKVQVVSVEAKNLDYETISEYLNRYHSRFPVYQDKKELVQGITDTYAGPMLMFADRHGKVKKLYRGYYRDLKWFGSLYWEHVIKGFDKNVR